MNALKEFLIRLSEAMRAKIRPLVVDEPTRTVVGASVGGDATFKVDEVAEEALSEFLEKEPFPVAYYSEDRGLVYLKERPDYLLIVDPIDGSRNAKSGFEACMISLALLPFQENPRYRDVTHGLLREIVGDGLFYAQRGKGCEIYKGDREVGLRLSQNTDLESMAWSMSVPGRPAGLIFQVMGELIDMSSLRGGFFSCNSTCFSLTRLLTGQLDAHVDIANRIMRQRPDYMDAFLKAGKGAVISIASHDLAAVLLVADEAGAIVTDGFGKPLSDSLLLSSEVENLQSLVAASNPELHKKLMDYLDARIKRL